MAIKQDLNIFINATDRASGTLKKAGGSFTKFAKIAGAASVALGVASVAAAYDFNKSMAAVSTLVDTTTESMDDMKDSVLEIARKTPVAINELTESLYDIRSAGIDAGDAMGVLENSAKLAVAGLGTTKEASDLVTSAINAFKLEGEEAEAVYDQIFTTVKTGKTTISQLSQGFGAVAGTVAAANIELPEYLASVAALTTTGLPAAQAHTQLKAAISGVTRDSKELGVVLDALGAESFKGLVEESGGMLNAFEQIVGQVDGNDAAILKLFGSTEAYNAVVQLTGELNGTARASFDDMADGVDSLDGAFTKMAEADQWQTFKNNINATLIELGDIALPAVNKGLKRVNENLAIGAKVAKDNATQLTNAETVHGDLERAIDNTSGTQQDYFKKLQRISVWELQYQKALQKGHFATADAALKNKNKEIVAVKEWQSEHEDSLSAASVAFGDFSVHTLGAISQVDDGMAKQIQASQSWGQHFMDNLIAGIAGREAELGSQVSNVIGIMQRLQFSTNEEMPSEIWGAHFLENFAGGVTAATPALNTSLGNVITITNAWGQEVQTTVGATGDFWSDYTTKVDDASKSQEEMFEDGINGIRDLSAEYDSEVGRMKDILDDLAGSLGSIMEEFGAKESENKTQLANAIVDSEKEVAGLLQQIGEEKNGVRKAQLEEQLANELEVLEQNKELIASVEAEVTEVKRWNNMTRLGQSIETFQKEQLALNEWKEDALAAWREQYTEAETTLLGITDLWNDRTELLKEFMSDEMDKNGELKASIIDSTFEVNTLIDRLRVLQSMGGGGLIGGGVPMLAEGGIVNSPTLAMIGEAGPEAVVPLSKLGTVGGGGSPIIINNYGVISQEEQLIEMLNPVVRELGLDNRLD